MYTRHAVAVAATTGMTGEVEAAHTRARLGGARIMCAARGARGGGRILGRGAWSSQFAPHRHDLRSVDGAYARLSTPEADAQVLAARAVATA